ncbi:MAG: PLP-dependent aminotransferase family protein [Acidobacteriaceae bacterium]|nr:PLP-dependent aminotransferase family protein [Acidobacteriaceae bacterium]
MIEMQYNFPLLPGMAAQWRERLRHAVDQLEDENFEELRPSFRTDMSAVIATGAKWMGMPAERTYLIEGVHHGTLIAMLAAGLAGQTIAVDELAYTGALDQARALGSPLVACRVDEEAMTPESLQAVCAAAAKTEKPVRGVYLTPNVHNPLGTTASLARREALVAVARDFDLCILEDNAYGFMDPAAPAAIATLAPERTFFVDGLSKCYAPATRTGFITVPERWKHAMHGAIKNTATGGSIVHARASASLIEDGTLAATIAAKNAEGATRNAAARALLGDRCHPGVKAAWHLWVRLPDGISPQSFEARMRERGILLTGGNWFAVAAGAPNGFRIALGGEPQRERMMQGIETIAKELKIL